MPTVPAPIVFSVGDKTIKFPTTAASLPGLSPAAVSEVLNIIERHAVDPKTVDVVKANTAGARFAVELSTYAVAETLRRLDRGETLPPYLNAVQNDTEFEVVGDAFKVVVERNPKVFKGKENAPAEPTSGN